MFSCFSNDTVDSSDSEEEDKDYHDDPYTDASDADVVDEKQWHQGCSASMTEEEQHHHHQFTASILASLRRLMEEHKVDYYLIPSGDAHGSEYVAAKDKRRAFVTGFTGSAGMAIVGKGAIAALFVDGRYHIQAAKQVDSLLWQLFKVGLEGVPTWQHWLEQAAPGSRVGYDATLFSIDEVTSLAHDLTSRSVALIPIVPNLVDVVWGSARPSPSTASLLLQAKYAGQASTVKLAQLRAFMAERGADAFVVSKLDEAAWLLNLRGSDIPFSPVFEAYVVVMKTGTTLYIDERKVVPEVKAYLQDLKVDVQPYEEVWKALASFKQQGKHCLLGNSSSYALLDALRTTNVYVVPSPLEVWKATKTATELAGLRAAYLRDALCWVGFAAWLTSALGSSNSSKITEFDAAEYLTSLRRKQPLYAGLAYENISASGANAALPHYSTAKKGAKVIDMRSPYLNDSGANYRDGTIDTTRTYYFGHAKSKPEYVRAYTRVLQGHIALATTVFPEGTTGSQLDAIARRPLWQDGMNYLHGTGHGLGSFLNVHEGPQGINSVSREALKSGMIVSIEPGYYEDGLFGIRIESIFAVREVETRRGFGGKWLAFERITQIPIDTSLVDKGLLSKEEKAWLSSHNQDVVKKLLPLVPKGDTRTKAWLKGQAYGV